MAQEEKLEEAKRLYETANADQRYVLKSLFPELKEREDEKIRKVLIDHFLRYKKQEECGVKTFYGIPTDLILAWLEKQGEQKPFDYENANIPQKDFAPKVEPKFKVGDFIKHNKANITCKVISVNSGSYYVENIGTGGRIELFNSEQGFHLWTIQDAKDGDVLASDNKNCPFIYRTKTIFGSPVAYCGVRSDGLFISESPENHQWCLKSEVTPATKELRDLLFEKMKEAGYEWDAKKKELKKIDNADKVEPKFKVGDFR